MDPLSALIGAGGSIGGGLLSAMMGQKSAMSMAQGDYLPGLMANAAKLGLSPLAVLGQHAPSVSSTVGDVGAGVAGAGRILAEMKDPHTVNMESLAEERARVDIANARIGGNNQAIQFAMQQEMFARLMQHPDLLPGDAQQPGILQLGNEWMRWLNKGVQGLGAAANRGFWDFLQHPLSQ